MVTFNLYASCVSRDILTPLIKSNRARVLQFCCFVNPISIFSEKPEVEVRAEDIKVKSNFQKRYFCQDVNKTSFEYLTEKTADYIVIDMLGVRSDVMKKGGHCISCSYPYNKQNKDILEQIYKMENYEKINFDSISEEDLIKNLNKFCNEIMRYYQPNKIILTECFGVTNYIDNDELKSFSNDRIERINKWNILIKKANEYVCNKFYGCHIIPFPSNVVADSSHHLGLYPLHYNSIYYEYGAKAIETIVKNHFDNEEVKILEDLRQVYSDRFKLLREKAELKRSNVIFKNTLEFTKALCHDIFEDNNFNKYVEKLKSNNKKVAILKSNDVAGKILLKALEKYKINVIFTTVKSNLKGLSDEDFDKCRQADVIISANVHSSVKTERDGVQVVMIKELLSEAENQNMFKDI